jgi:hypothetical protein
MTKAPLTSRLLWTLAAIVSGALLVGTTAAVFGNALLF